MLVTVGAIHEAEFFLKQGLRLSKDMSSSISTFDLSILSAELLMKRFQFDEMLQTIVDVKTLTSVSFPLLVMLLELPLGMNEDNLPSNPNGY